MPDETRDEDQAEDGWMEDREVFAKEVVDVLGGGKVSRLYITEAAKRRWDPKNPPRFTPQVAIEIVQYLMVAATKSDAAAAAGVTKQTVNNWINYAKDPAKTTEELRAFASWCGRSRALRRIEALRRIQKAGADDWKAEAFVLERSDPDNWRQRNSSILENPDGTPMSPPCIQVVFTKTPTERDATVDVGVEPATD